MAELRMKSASTSKSVFFSTFFSLIARGLSFVQALIVSYYFGTTKSTDFLFFCVSITMLLPGLFDNINQSVIVPNAIRIRERKSEAESRGFISCIYLVYLVAGAAMCAVISLVPENFMLLVSKFDRTAVEENILIVKLIIPTFFFIVANSYLLDVFNSYKYFTFPMLLDMLKSLLTILFIVMLGRTYGVVSMAAGILLAHIVQFILLNAFLLRLFDFKLSFRLYRLDGELRRNIFYVVVSQAATILSQYVAMYLISGLNEGVYTALNFSDRLYGIFVLVFAGQVATVFGINMIELYARGDYKELNEKYLKYLKATMTITLPVCFILAVKAPLVISILFERGSFTSESVQLTSIFFKYSILIVPLLLLDRLIVRLIIAKQIMRISFVWNVVSKIFTCLAVYIIVSYVDFRYYGLGLLLVQFIYIILINLFMVKKQFGFIQVNSSLRYLAVSTALCAAICLGTDLFFPSEITGGIVQKLASLIAYSVVTAGGYCLIGLAGYNRETILQLLQYFKQLLPGRLKAGSCQTDKLM